MSHDAHAPAEGGGDTGKIFQAINDVMSPQANVQSKTVVSNWAGVGARIYDTTKHTIAAIADLIPGAIETAIATPNNLLGLTSKGIDKIIVQPIDRFRARFNNVLTNPSSLFEAGGGDGHGAAHAH